MDGLGAMPVMRRSPEVQIQSKLAHLNSSADKGINRAMPCKLTDSVCFTAHIILYSEFVDELRVFVNDIFREPDGV